MTDADVDRDDRGSASVGLVMMVVIAVAGAALIFDGARYLAAERHASNTAEGAARAAIATGSPADGLDADTRPPSRHRPRRPPRRPGHRRHRLVPFPRRRRS